MDNIRYIPIENLYPHPDNPRKELGDLSEMVESIKRSGILQNLTVVPEPALPSGSYRVLIGHRRLAAAKLAGLTELPCAVVQMLYNEQVATMMAENMQRQDLTMTEQIQGIQLMLDLGENVQSISTKTGLSESTVRRRMKLAELPPDKLEKAESRGGTLQDYAMLDKLQDADLKAKALDAIGTPNFKMTVDNAVDEEKKRRYLEHIETMLIEMGFEKVKQVPTGYTYIRNFYIGRKDPFDCPGDAKERKYIYRIGHSQIELYAEKIKTGPTEEEIAHQRHMDAIEVQEARLKELDERMADNRYDFITAFEEKDGRLRMAEITKALIQKIAGPNGAIKGEKLADLLGVDIDKGDLQPLWKKVERVPHMALAVAVYLLLSPYDGRFWVRDYNYINSKSWPKIKRGANKPMRQLYDYLTAIGYEPNTDEQQMMAGTHPLLQEVAEK